MQLHQVNQLNYPAELENTWQNSLQRGDHVLVIEEACLRTCLQIDLMKKLVADKQVTLYYLQSDADAYGISPQVGTALSDEEWVELTFASKAHISW